MNRISGLACVGVWLALFWSGGADDAWAQAAEKADEQARQIDLTQAAGKPLSDGSLEAAGGIAALLGALTTETRFESIAVPGTFTPWQGPELALAPDQHDGNSDRLRENMKHKGWECPSGYSAHHIASKGDYRQGDPNYGALRDCLKKWGINIDAAGNGVCLPGKTATAAQDTSFSHKGREGNIHGPDVTLHMLEQCQSASSSKNMQNLLDSWRKALTEAKRFW
jgi:hypothetical protein